MDVFQILKQACSREHAITYKKWKNLQVGKYNVKYFKLVTNQNGLGLCVYMDNFFVYMPSYILRKINQEEQIEELNKKRAVMDYQGRENQQPILNFEFYEKNNDESDNSEEDEEKALGRTPPPPPPKKQRKR